MNFNKITLLLSIFVLFLSISAVSADGNDTEEIANTTIEVEDFEKWYDNGTGLTGTLLSNGTPVSNQNVTIYINGVNYTKPTDENGTFKLGIGLRPGTYYTTVYFLGTETLAPSTANLTITVLSTIDGDNLTKLFRNDSQFHATVVDGEGNPVVNTNVSMNINGVIYNRPTDENGTATLEINLRQGTYILTVTNPNDGLQKSFNIEVLPTILGEDLTKYCRNDSQFFVDVIDGEGNPVANTNVAMNINGVIYNRLTNENGTANLTINLNPGNYIITTTTDNGFQISFNIKVLSTIISPDVLTKYFQNGTQFIATILNGEGNPVANSGVSVLINGQYYPRTTDANGTISLSINLAPGTYTATVVNQYGGNCSKSTTIVVLPTLIVNDISMNYNWNGTSGYYTVKLVNGTGQAVANETISLNINGRFYNVTTNENGTGSLPINLNPGKYTITAKHGDSSVSSTVTVSRMEALISVVSNTIKTGDLYQVKVTGKASGKAVGGIFVYFIFEGKGYQTITNAEGIASVRMNVNPATYQMITALQDDIFYGDMAVYNTLTVTR